VGIKVLQTGKAKALKVLVTRRALAEDVWNRHSLHPSGGGSSGDGEVREVSL
jgi:hypothetical protein